MPLRWAPDTCHCIVTGHFHPDISLPGHPLPRENYRRRHLPSGYGQGANIHTFAAPAADKLTLIACTANPPFDFAPASALKSAAQCPA